MVRNASPQADGADAHIAGIDQPVLSIVVEGSAAGQQLRHEADESAARSGWQIINPLGIRARLDHCASWWACGARLSVGRSVLLSERSLNASFSQH